MQFLDKPANGNGAPPTNGEAAAQTAASGTADPDDTAGEIPF